MVGNGRLYMLGLGYPEPGSPDSTVYDVSGLPGFVAVETPCGPTPLLVELTAFTAEAVSSGVLLRWTTASEIDNAGFRLLRGSEAKNLQVVSPWIPAKGDELTGGDYEYLERFAGPLRGTLYYLEDIDVFGRRTRHGPIKIDRGTRTIPTTHRTR